MLRHDIVKDVVFSHGECDADTSNRIVSVPQRYDVRLGDSIEDDGVEYRIVGIAGYFESGEWQRRLFLKHDQENCRACMRHEYCGCPPCPEAEWPNIVQVEADA